MTIYGAVVPDREEEYIRGGAVEALRELRGGGLDQ